MGQIQNRIDIQIKIVKTRSNQSLSIVIYIIHDKHNKSNILLVV